jgi:hypothetical protein
MTDEEPEMQGAIVILSLSFVALGVVGFLLAQVLGIMRGIREIRGRRKDHPKGPPLQGQ